MDEETMNKRNDRRPISLNEGDHKSGIHAKNELDLVPVITITFLDEPKDVEKDDEKDHGKIKLEDNKRTGSGFEEGIEDKPVERKCWERFLGMFLMTLASVCFSGSVAIVKALDGYPVFSIGAWVSFGGCFLPTLPVLLYCHFIQKSKPFKPVYPMWRRPKFKTVALLFVRGISGSAAIMFQYNSMKYLSMSDTTVICFSTPVFVTFLACLLLGETFGFMNIVAAVITLVGVVIITRPPFITGEREMDTDVLIGAGLALAAMSCVTSVYLTLRLLKEVNFALLSFAFGTVGTIFCTVLSEIFGGFQIPNKPWDFFLVFCSNCLTFGGQVTMSLAFKFEDASPLSLIRSFDVIFSFIWQAIFFNINPDQFSIIGAAVVLSGVLLIGIRKQVSTLPKDNPCRKMCCFILL